MESCWMGFGVATYLELVESREVSFLLSRISHS
jgi:hypothetical protein